MAIEALAAALVTALATKAFEKAGEKVGEESGNTALSLIKGLFTPDELITLNLSADALQDPKAQGKLEGAGNKVVTREAMELSRLRAENVRLKRENEIIKKAAAYFAKDAL